MDEFAIKRARLQRLMDDRGVDAILLANTANVAWLSGGKRSYIDTSSEQGVAQLLVTRDRRYVLTNNIEGERLRTEEGFDGWEIVADPWHASSNSIERLTHGLRLGADVAQQNAVDLSGELIRLRAPLTDGEIQRYRSLGHDAGAALASVARRLESGMSEYVIAGMIAESAYRIGAVPIVVLVASDERLMKIRHPLPTDKRFERSAMVVLCARRDGLIANLTRLIHVGPAPEELQRRLRAVAEIDARAIVATRPGARVADVFRTIQQAYAAVGFGDEWRHHHQGGACSYGGRDYIATPESDQVVQAPQAFAWNPSVPGAKSEDTVLISEDGFEVLTPSPDWPMITVEVDGRRIERPGVLEV
jgi:Xaa-Pro aminopeptidase